MFVLIKVEAAHQQTGGSPLYEPASGGEGLCCDGSSALQEASLIPLRVGCTAALLEPLCGMCTESFGWRTEGLYYNL